MKQYSHNGNSYLVHEGELYVRCSENQETPEPQTRDERANIKTPPGKDCYCGRPAGHTGIHKGTKLNKKAKGKSSCSLCNKVGHNAKTCPERKSADPDFQEPKDEIDGGIDDFTPEAQEKFVNTVREMKDQGMNSIQIAARLHTTLKKVNEAW